MSNDRDKHLEDVLNEVKKILDRSYKINKEKYDEKAAISAMMRLLNDKDFSGFTRDENARYGVKQLVNRPNEISWVLLDYALSSFILNNMDVDITLDEIKVSANNNAKENAYENRKAIKLVALSFSLYGIYWVINLLNVNREIRRQLVKDLINERYVEKKASKLDNSVVSEIIKIDNFSGKPISVLVSKRDLNKSIKSKNEEEKVLEFKAPEL